MAGRKGVEKTGNEWAMCGARDDAAIMKEA